MGHDLWLNKNEFETSSSKKNENGSVQAGTHLIIVDDSSCRETTASKLSNPKILNYYRGTRLQQQAMFHSDRNAKISSRFVFANLKIGHKNYLIGWRKKYFLRTYRI